MAEARPIRATSPKTILTLSALTGLLHEDARTAALIDGWLERIDAVRAAGEAEAADQLTDDLVAFVFDPAGAARASLHRAMTTYAAPTATDLAGDETSAPRPRLVPETELRALWGDR